MRKQFDIKFRPQIESGEYKVETRSGQTARIVCWDRVGPQLVVLVGKDEDVLTYNLDGTTGQQMALPSDLFIVTPEEELSEFERVVKDRLWRTLEYSETFRKDENKWTRELAAELLTIAKQQLLQSGELLTQEHHEKLMDALYKETLDGVKKNWRDYFTPRAVTDIYNAGRNYVLKNLPRWKKLIRPTEGPVSLIKTWYGAYRIDNHIEPGNSFIPLSMLETLPGFKED